MRLVLCSYARVRTRQSSELGLKFVAMDLLKEKNSAGTDENSVATVQHFLFCSLAAIPNHSPILTTPTKYLD